MSYISTQSHKNKNNTNIQIQFTALQYTVHSTVHSYYTVYGVVVVVSSPENLEFIRSLPGPGRGCDRIM